MEINKTIELVNDLMSNTWNKKEIKIYNSFLSILKSLVDTNLSDEKQLSVWEKIEKLELSSIQVNRTKYLKIQLKEFIKFLENDLNLVQDQHYLSIVMSLWMVFWIAFTSIFHVDFAMWNETTGWLIFGMMIWMFIWSVIDSKAKKEKRVFKVR